jgi:hypothetical protein
MCCIFFFFFKQKTAYEISVFVWSSECAIRFFFQAEDGIRAARE